MKEKIEPYCELCYEEVCIKSGCPACGDYCPVSDLPGICRYEERRDMTPKKAWENISFRLKIYAEEHGFTDEDVAAEVMAFRVLSAAEDKNEKSDD